LAYQDIEYTLDAVRNVERYTNNAYGDHLGSAQLVTDWRGSIYEHLEYTPYGELWVDHATSEVGMNPTLFRFTGKELDVETGFYYYGTRYLDPKTSRWISADPAMGEYVPLAPINDDAKKHNQNLPGMGGIFNLVNMHVYHYAGNNPVVLIDPDGRTPRSYKLSENRYTFSPDRSTRDGAAALYNYARTRMDKLHQEGVFSYTTNKVGSIRSCSYRNSDFDSLRQELKLFKESIEK